MSEPQQPSAQPYGAPTPPSPYTSSSPYGAPVPAHSAPAGNQLGLTAFLVAVASAGLGILLSIVTPFLYISGNYDVADSLSAVVGIIVLLGGIAAVVLSILALRRPAPHLLAAIALGISGSLVIARVLTWASSLLYYLS